MLCSGLMYWKRKCISKNLYWRISSDGPVESYRRSFPSRQYVTFVIYDNDILIIAYSWTSSHISAWSMRQCTVVDLSLVVACDLWLHHAAEDYTQAFCRDICQEQKYHSVLESVYFFCCRNTITVFAEYSWVRAKLQFCVFSKYRCAQNYYCK